MVASLTRELAAERSFRDASACPVTATASSRSADMFEWTAICRRGGWLTLEAIGSGRGGMALEAQDGTVRRFNLTHRVGSGPQTVMVFPRIVVTRGGGLGFVIVDDWWRP